MDLSRRSFLRGALSVAAASVAAPSLAKALPHADAYPILHGDGIHDDTAALNALFAGEPVWCEGKLIKDTSRTIVLNEGVYRITRTVVVGRDFTTVCGATFVADQSFPASAPLMQIKAKRAAILNNMFVGNSRSVGVRVQ